MQTILHNGIFENENPKTRNTSIGNPWKMPYQNATDEYQTESLGNIIYDR